MMTMDLGDKLRHRDSKPYPERRLVPAIPLPLRVEELIERLGIGDEGHGVTDELAGGVVEQDLLRRGKPAVPIRRGRVSERVGDDLLDLVAAIVHRGLKENLGQDPRFRGDQKDLALGSFGQGRGRKFQLLLPTGTDRHPSPASAAVKRIPTHPDSRRV